MHCDLGPTCCMDCLEGEPPDPGPMPEQRLQPEIYIRARVDSPCARNSGHLIERGDRIGLVADLGWCCPECIL